MNANDKKKLLIATGVSLSFFILMATIVVLTAKKVVTGQMAMLMFVALLGLYVGFGLLIAVYRFVGKLD